MNMITNPVLLEQEVFPNCSHFIQEERLELLYQQITEFISGLVQYQ